MNEIGCFLQQRLGAHNLVAQSSDGRERWLLARTSNNLEDALMEELKANVDRAWHLTTRPLWAPLPLG